MLNYVSKIISATFYHWKNQAKFLPPHTLWLNSIIYMPNANPCNKLRQYILNHLYAWLFIFFDGVYWIFLVGHMLAYELIERQYVLKHHSQRLCEDGFLFSLVMIAGTSS